MNLHEYQAKQILGNYKLPVSKGVVCFSVDEIEQAIQTLGGDKWVVKCQVHTGGRGKAGGVKLVNTIDDARAFAEKWLGKNLVTFQTTEEGLPVSAIYIEEPSEIESELYLSAIIDRSSQKIVFMASRAGVTTVKSLADIGIALKKVLA